VKRYKPLLLPIQIPSVSAIELPQQSI
jgi:hypothetical protein